jgi:hypothetical protein
MATSSNGGACFDSGSRLRVEISSSKLPLLFVRREVIERAASSCSVESGGRE